MGPPQAHIFYVNRAIVHSKRQAWDKMVRDARMATDIQPEYAKGYHCLARGLLMTHDLHGAIAASEVAVTLQPSSESFQKMLSECLEKRPVGESDGVEEGPASSMELKPSTQTSSHSSSDVVPAAHMETIEEPGVMTRQELEAALMAAQEEITELQLTNNGIEGVFGVMASSIDTYRRRISLVGNTSSQNSFQALAPLSVGSVKEAIVTMGIEARAVPALQDVAMACDALSEEIDQLDQRMIGDQRQELGIATASFVSNRTDSIELHLLKHKICLGQVFTGVLYYLFDTVNEKVAPTIKFSVFLTLLEKEPRKRSDDEKRWNVVKGVLSLASPEGFLLIHILRDDRNFNTHSFEGTIGDMREFLITWVRELCSRTQTETEHESLSQILDLYFKTLPPSSFYRTPRKASELKKYQG
ncbi:hypothetical protein KIPB_009629 [Kipferlia bialata]|uniref:Uncharacterized protein n=1 Tax=Kipferlia bialata TaxID=797122 RepID=A0A9K3D233_9EUKA|nr:hypothetical protein KIPB_009629 [Kipferlia bialata]|eukprot:g9629.t1